MSRKKKTIKPRTDAVLRIGMSVVRNPVNMVPAWSVCKQSDKEESRTPMRGRVVYIHPRGRFHVVAFPSVDGKEIRETFQGVEV